MNSSGHPGTALITGASSGIGAVYADRLARRGYDLLLVARDLARLERQAKRLAKKYRIQVEVLTADLSQAAGIERVAQRLRADQQLTLLVNNAGMTLTGSLVESDRYSVAELLQLNVLALTLLSSAAAVNFSMAGRGAIINLGSVGALLPERFNAVYAASKAYVLSLTQSLQAEIGERGVQIQAVLAGTTRSELRRRSLPRPGALETPMMDAGDLVDAALHGFDLGELVTIASLPDNADWQGLLQARLRLATPLSPKQPAAHCN